ncbi:hypothetical protein HPQ32_14260 [Photobacterium carnosum]|uniref:hypothetical protein n=1 Tax=Photobacterium carnosum TaxID=2023717 RepID=UPI001C91A4F0|nr:hypothetical protein [Photobacterium carnosum]MBY3789585.1 hypothetical protein [Photobacterium carnosum]MCD9534645.1 hypothetical protein [Photobacterium carnosum]
MGGGGDNEVKETAAQIAAAEVANKQWDIYNNELKGFEDTFMQRVDNFNSASNMANTKQDTDLAYATTFSDARESAQDQLASAGVDPTSQKYQQTMSGISSDQTIQQADTVNRAQTAEQDKHMAGLQDITAMGMGQKSEALSGMGNVADSSIRKAQTDAQDAFNRRASNQQLVGTIAGAGASYGLRGVSKVTPKPTTPALSTGTHGVTQNGMQVSSVKYDPLNRKW